MRLSIVTPSFRQLDWLRLCIASVRDQVHGGDHPDLSVAHLIQDGGSEGIEDLSRAEGAVLRRSERASDPTCNASRYHLTVREAGDAGMYDAINRGLRASTGDVCAYLNCDEQYLPGVLPRVASWFRDHPATEVLFCDAIVVDAAGGYLADRRVTLPTPWHTRVSGNLAVFTSSTFFRRSILEDRMLWFDPSWRALGDAEWVLRLLDARVSMKTVPLCASVHTDTGENLVLSPVARLEARRLSATASWWARRTRPFAVLGHRLRRWRAGAYALEPHRYSIYTQSSPSERVTFEVRHPTSRWRR